MIIREALLKIKSLLLSVPQELSLGLIIFLVGTASFGLGRLSTEEVARSPVRIDSSMAAVATVQAAGKGTEGRAPAGGPEGAGEVVASKNGSKYHFPWCPGAKNISEKNKISFASAAEAESAGYTIAANCK